MADVLKLTDRLAAELPQMLAEHGTIVEALNRLREAAARAGRGDIVEFARALTEHARTEARMAAKIFPRASAVAEIGWSAKPDTFGGFVSRLLPQIERVERLGLAPATDAFAVTLDAVFAADELAFFMATRNPATFVQAVFEQARAQSVESYLGGMPPSGILWS